MSDLPPNDRTDMDTRGAIGADLDPQTQDLRAALRENDEKARKDSRNIPPLAWIVVALLVIVGAVAYFYSSGVMTGPRGGTSPVPAAQPAPSPSNP
ncbi:MAG: hypothetical protein ACXWVJ_03440 [Caulobacteraceae bacterium]